MMDAAERRAYFINGECFLAELGAQFPVGVNDDVEIRMLVRLPWPDVNRSSRAIQAIDAELRRAARALASVEAEEDELGLFSPVGGGDGHVARFRKVLLDAKSPDASGTGHLKIVSATSSPLRLFLEPSGSVVGLLRRHPLAAVTFAMSEFGMRMTVNERRHARLEAVEFGGPDSGRDAMDRALWTEEWSGSKVGRSRSYVAPGRPGLFRAVSAATTTAEHYASLCLYLYSPSSADGYFVSVQLLDARATTTDFGDRLPST